MMTSSIIGHINCCGLLTLLLIVLIQTLLVSSEENKTKEEVCKDPSCGVRIVTIDELSQYKGENDGDIWLSILGEVYDVTHGEGRGYYGGGPKGYGIFAGRDCSIAFITGKFKEDECSKSYDEVNVKQIKELFNWKKFYEDHDIYKFVGLLDDPRYYDKDGHKTEDMKLLEERLETFLAESKNNKKTTTATTKTNNNKLKPSTCNVKTKENCIEKEIQYINKRKTKSNNEQHIEIQRLTAILEKDGASASGGSIDSQNKQKKKTSLKPEAVQWIQTRIRFLRELVKDDESSQTTATTTSGEESTDKVKNTADHNSNDEKNQQKVEL